MPPKANEPDAATRYPQYIRDGFRPMSPDHEHFLDEHESSQPMILEDKSNGTICCVSVPGSLLMPGCVACINAVWETESFVGIHFQDRHFTGTAWVESLASGWNAGRMIVQAGTESVFLRAKRTL